MILPWNMQKIKMKLDNFLLNSIHFYQRTCPNGYLINYANLYSKSFFNELFCFSVFRTIKKYWVYYIRIKKLVFSISQITSVSINHPISFNKISYLWADGWNFWNVMAKYSISELSLQTRSLCFVALTIEYLKIKIVS